MGERMTDTDACLLCGNDTDNCLLCGKEFLIGEDGNELGFCVTCQEKKDFPYDLDKYYEDYDNNKVVFKGFETMSRGILEKYRKGMNDEKTLPKL